MSFLSANLPGVLGGVGLIASIFGGASQRKQQQELVNQMMRIAQDNRNRQIKLAMPYYQAGQEGLEQTRAFANEMNRKRFANNPYYDQARQTSLNEANRQIAQSSKSSVYAFSQNQGRARGEQARAGRLGIQAKNSINLNWARSTEADRMQKTQMYLNGVSQLNQMGHTGTNIMSNAYNNFAQQSMNALSMTPIDSTMSDIGGGLMGVGINSLLKQFSMQGGETEGESGGQGGNTGGSGDLGGNLDNSFGGGMVTVNHPQKGYIQIPASRLPDWRAGKIWMF